MKTIIMFPGQGSQQPGMGAALFKLFPKEVSLANDILGYNVEQLCLESEFSTKLQQTRYTQPLLYLVNALSALKHTQTAENPPGDIFIGHSLGEYNALSCSGVFSFATGLKLVKERGQAMEEAAQNASTAGGMLAVLGLAETAIQTTITDLRLTETVFIANLNTRQQIILSGAKSSLATLSEPLKKAGAKKCVPLNVSGAFHSPYMNPAAAHMETYLEQFTFAEPQKPVYANFTAEPYPKTEVEIKKTLTRQITQQVRWSQTLLTLRESYPDAIFIELGPGNVLKGLLKRL